MKYFYRSLLCSILLFAACKKETVTEYRSVPGNSKEVKLTIDKVINDSTLVIKWTKYGGSDFLKYKLTRQAAPMEDRSHSTTIIMETSDQNKLEFEERQMPYSRDITYILSVVTKDQKEIHWSVVHTRTTAQQVAAFNDAQISKSAKKLYLFNYDFGRITAYDYVSNKIVANTNLKRKISYIAAADYQGNPEVYVPTADGWILILDGNNLTLKDKIYVGGRAITSVIAVNEKLIASTSDASESRNDNQHIKIYRRSDKKVIGVTGNYYNSRLLYLENSSYNFIELSTTVVPVNLSAFTIDGSGTPVSKGHKTYFGLEVYPSIIKSFPAGDKFITSLYGTVFSADLTYQKNIIQPADGQLFSDFEFSQDGSMVYCAHLSLAKITAIDYNSLEIRKTFATKYLPVRIFRDGQQLISVNKSPYYFSTKGESVYSVQKFTL
ncbi:hypothetical protein [Pedobacter sp. JY14-1]|uniref:hypothetical protein n=1 Tax=Pedobacter sp. JY14-1 TaxID=3034151 RepID=UPI0023E1ECAC|nr:hypothetical protein [Pedobacter sp. JY14-1]